MGVCRMLDVYNFFSFNIGSSFWLMVFADLSIGFIEGVAKEKCILCSQTTCITSHCIEEIMRVAVHC